MNFFINSDLSNLSSGIEHAQLKRLRLFQQFGQPAKILTTYYRNNWAEGPGRFGLTTNDVLNIFDYFGHNIHVHHRPNHIAQFCRHHQYQILQNLGRQGVEQGYLVQTADGQKAVVRVYIPDQQVISVAFGNETSKRTTYAEGYDTRGFLSIKYYFGTQGKLTKQEIVNDQGQVFCTEIFNRSGTKVLYTDLIFRGQTQRFHDLPTLQAYFLDQVNQDYTGKNLFISDRYECTEGLGRMQTPATKVVFIHSHFITHFDGDVLTDKLNYNYEFGLTHPQKFDLFICPTEQERSDIQRRFPNIEHQVVAIPGGYTKNNWSPVAIQQRDANQIMMVARISAEKQIPQALLILQRVLNHLPHVHLDIYGGVTSTEEYQLVQAQIQALHLQGAVRLKGNIDNLSHYYDQARVLLSTSNTEGFCLSLLEALDHGVPVVGYDCRYGNKEIIQDGSNGYLISLNDLQQATQRVIQILTNSTLAQKLSTQAYQSAKQFAAPQLWSRWQKVLQRSNL